MTKRLFIFGLGFSGLAIATDARALGFDVAGTVRDADKAARTARDDFDVLVFDGASRGEPVAAALMRATHVVSTVAPPRHGKRGDESAKLPPGAVDPVLAFHEADLAAAPHLERLIYLSTIGVYGDHGGAWIDETASIDETSPRAVARLAAEDAWRGLGRGLDIPVQVHRLGGIYGPGRSQLDALREGRARRIVKPGQVFNRIHVADVAGAVVAGWDRGESFTVNLVDDEPAPPQDVVAFGAGLLDLPPPPEVAFEAADLSPMGRAFYGANRRLSNARAKAMTGHALRFPTYREGLRDVLRAETAA